MGCVNGSLALRPVERSRSVAIYSKKGSCGNVRMLGSEAIVVSIVVYRGGSPSVHAHRNAELFCKSEHLPPNLECQEDIPTNR